MSPPSSHEPASVVCGRTGRYRSLPDLMAAPGFSSIVALPPNAPTERMLTGRGAALAVLVGWWPLRKTGCGLLVILDQLVHMQPMNVEFVDVKMADPCATDQQSPDGQRPDR
jgi:hypothetical protein